MPAWPIERAFPNASPPARVEARVPGILLIPLLLALLPGAAMAGETLDYAVLEDYGEFELRRYPAYLVAETEVSGTFDQVGDPAFRVLSDYIFGANRSERRIAMTAPVVQRPAGGGAMATTAPVVRARRDGSRSGSYVLAFVMPAEYSRESLPRPVDPRVSIRSVEPRLVAARRYSGRWTERNYRDNERVLLAALREAGLAPAGVPSYARYNSPFSPWFLRRNEVWVEVREAGR